MHPYPISPLLRARESFRFALRNCLRYMLACTLLVMILNGWLAPAYLATHPFSNIFVTSLLLGIPIGFAVFCFFALFRFAFKRN